MHLCGDFSLRALQIHDSGPISVKRLKSLGDKTIQEQHFTIRDFLEAVSYSSFK